jgi:hypothetical protein
VPAQTPKTALQPSTMSASGRTKPIRGIILADTQAERRCQRCCEPVKEQRAGFCPALVGLMGISKALASRPSSQGNDGQARRDNGGQSQLLTIGFAGHGPIDHVFAVRNEQVVRLVTALTSRQLLVAQSPTARDPNNLLIAILLSEVSSEPPEFCKNRAASGTMWIEMRPLCLLPFVKNHAGNLRQFPQRHLPQGNNNRLAAPNTRNDEISYKDFCEGNRLELA